ncbi:MAG: response regulator [Oligoflexales bacterium]|nr:response regulator [Oligoflexales bacterium]
MKRKKIASAPIVNLNAYREVICDKKKQVILVVDDDEIMRNAMKRILEAEGYNVLLAEDGMELSKVLETNKLDLILLDVNLPWVNGYELCEILKKDINFKKVPLILVSNQKDAENIKRGFAVGCDDYISKPFKIEMITSAVSKALINSE